MLCVLLLAILAGAIGSCISVRIPESGSRQTVLFYSRHTDLIPGARLDPDDLEARLGRLGYQEVADSLNVGQYRSVNGGFEIYLRPFRYHDFHSHAGRLRVLIEGGKIESIEAIDILSSDDCRLEPERIAGYEGSVGALLNPIRLDSAPPLLIDAVIAIEDRRFYRHPGIDPIGFARAVWSNIRYREWLQGGSTLTQQLARSLFLHNRKTISRKIEEAFLAIGLEMRYSKKEILEAYLNALYWGSWGAMEIRGAREASRYYLGCEIEEADPAGIALLVALVRAPNAYSPYADQDKARRRRDMVLRILHDRGILTEDEVRIAMDSPLPTEQPPDRIADASYFLDAARKEIERRAPPGTLEQSGISVFTTLDPRDQAAAVASLRGGIEELERKHRKLRGKSTPLQGAVVILDPHEGEVRALVGGRDYLTGQFNRAVDAQRQPGSVFKPFVYLAAFQNPRREDGTYWTPATIMIDEPTEIPAKPDPYKPKSYNKEYQGDVTLRTALEKSLNVPTALVGYEVGISKVANAARDLGIRSSLNEFPSLALGASEVNLLEITAAYGGFATLGVARTPILVRGILGPMGRAISLKERRNPPGAEPRDAYLVTNLLRGVIDSGTGQLARQLGVRGSVAGKTGTTNDFRDAWFIGFTPLRVAGVWIGFDRDDVAGLPGATAALPIWSSIMKAIQIEGGEGTYLRPDGIVTVPIDPETGLLATGECPTFLLEDFVAGTEPATECDVHGKGFFDRLKRFFRI